MLDIQQLRRDLPGVLARLTGANGALVDPAAPTGADPD